VNYLESNQLEFRVTLSFNVFILPEMGAALSPEATALFVPPDFSF
jgi:hypothetical protein